MPWFRAIQCWICDWIVDSLYLWTPQRLSCQPYPTMRRFIKPRIFAAILGVLKMRPTKWPKMVWFNYWEPGPKATNWMNVLSKILAVKQYETIWIHWNIKRSPVWSHRCEQKEQSHGAIRRRSDRKMMGFHPYLHFISSLESIWRDLIGNYISSTIAIKGQLQITVTSQLIEKAWKSNINI